MIAGVVLAAGRSSRMAPAHKLLAPFGGSSVIGTTVACLAAVGGVDPLVVVTGHEAERVEAAVAGTRAVVVRTASFGAGLSASLEAGLRAVPAAADWVMVMLGDMPLVRVSTVERLAAAAAAASEADVVAPSFDGRRGHPVLWRGCWRELLGAPRADEGGRALMAGLSVRTVAVDDPGVLVDVDDEAGLARARAMWTP